METIDTIITNAGILAHAHIDWSPGAGPIWLAGYMAVMVVFGAYCTIQGVRAERRQDRQALYRQAERVGALRSSARETV
jgi:hypothetical protein